MAIDTTDPLQFEFSNSNPSQSDFLRRYGKPGLPGLPKYAQLRETLFEAIKAGHWKPGSRLPTESDLTRMTRLSLGTVQRALRELANDGVVVRSQGSGTYVAEDRAAIDEPLHLRFRGTEGEPAFLPLFPKVLSRTRIDEQGPWSSWLKQAGSNIVRINRQLNVNDEFIVFNRFYVNTDTFPDITRRPISALDGANLKQMLGQSMNMPITEIRQFVSWVKFNEEACAAMSVKAGTRGMLLESGAIAGRGNPVYFLESFIPPNTRRLDVSPS